MNFEERLAELSYARWHLRRVRHILNRFPCPRGIPLRDFVGPMPPVWHPHWDQYMPAELWEVPGDPST